MTIPDPANETVLAIRSWASARNAVRAVLLTSTRAIPDAEVDALSDYDVILIVEDIHPFIDDRTWLDDFGEVLVAYWDPIHPDPLYGIEFCSNVVQYIHGLKIDFTLWPVALLEQIAAASTLPAELDAGYLVLFDRDHLAKALQAPTGMAYLPAQPSLTAFQLMINDFLSDAPYVAKCLWRGELLPAKWCLECDMIHTYLRPMLEWRAEIDHQWSVPVGNHGKGLKKLLPPDSWSALERTFVGADIALNWESLINTMELFHRVSIQVGDYFGYAYPEPLYEAVHAYVETIRQIPSASPSAE